MFYPISLLLSFVFAHKTSLWQRAVDLSFLYQAPQMEIELKLESSFKKKPNNKKPQTSVCRSYPQGMKKHILLLKKHTNTQTNQKKNQQNNNQPTKTHMNSCMSHSSSLPSVLSHMEIKVCSASLSAILCKAIRTLSIKKRILIGVENTHHLSDEASIRPQVLLLSFTLGKINMKLL